MIRLTALMSLVCAVLCACGTTGKTSPFVLNLEVPKDQPPLSNLQVASAAMDPEGVILNAVGVRPWGKFEAEDLRNIERSLRDTLALHTPPTARSTQPRLHVHLMVRRYMVSLSNNAGAVLASVTWALTEPDGKLVYQEQFFASDSVYLIGTIGLLKESVHKAMVRRIATAALALAAGRSVEKGLPTSFENTYASFDEATARLPRTMVSMGIPSLAVSPSLPLTAVGLLTPSGISTVQWTMTRPSQDFDWPGYLEKVYALGL